MLFALIFLVISSQAFSSPHDCKKAILEHENESLPFNKGSGLTRKQKNNSRNQVSGDFKNNQAVPFLRWVGGKRGNLASFIASLIESFPQGSLRDYYEPCLGSGAVFFAVNSINGIKNAHLSDLIPELIITYKVLRDRPEELISELKLYDEQIISEEQYLEVREIYNQQKGGLNGLKDSHELKNRELNLASMFRYLNRTCYNGLHRLNKHGGFNASYGQFKKRLICDENTLRQASKALSEANLNSHSFEKINPQKGDIVYCDPPYHGGFAGYTEKKFPDDDQVALRDACNQWYHNGAYVISSNNSTPFIRKHYSGYKLIEIQVLKKVSCTPKNRGKYPELLILSPNLYNLILEQQVDIETLLKSHKLN